jgi:hypothetical protein
MTVFLRLLDAENKEEALKDVVKLQGERRFEVEPESFTIIPGAPFAYWVSDAIREAFREFEATGSNGREAWVGLQTNNDFQWLRLWWENADDESELYRLVPHPKGGSYSKFYADVFLSVRWGDAGRLMKTWKSEQLRLGRITANNSKCWNEKDYLRPGLTWPLRTTLLSVRVMPANCIFGQKGPAAFVPKNDPFELMILCAVTNSAPFNYLISTQLARTELSRSFEVGLIGQTPFPRIDEVSSSILKALALRSWSLMRTRDSINETSHAFQLPAALRAQLGDYDASAIEAELIDSQAAIDGITFDLYGFSDADRDAALGSSDAEGEDASDAAEDASNSEDDDGAEAVDQTDGLLSWAAGVAFGRFDWRLATGERSAPPEPDPFDPLPPKSPGMLLDDAEPFYAHSGILVDDQGHPDDLARLIEEVLVRVEAPVPADVRRWLQRDFFPLHLKQYSKSRRKAPIYWPISTSSGSYTLWLYYPSLTSQTLYTAINDFIEGPNCKLQQVEQDLIALRNKGSARSDADEKSFEKLQSLEAELIELRETILEIAPNYHPNHDDGVQISAAPLWRLFRHKPWQKVLKDTWTKLENGDYDWAHLALAYWPDRVREKCKTDKSLAIAHDLEDLYVEPEVVPGAKRGRKKTGGAA